MQEKTEISDVLENISLGELVRFLNNRKLNLNFEKNYLFRVYWHN